MDCVPISERRTAIYQNNEGTQVICSLNYSLSQNRKAGVNCKVGERSILAYALYYLHSDWDFVYNFMG